MPNRVRVATIARVFLVVFITFPSIASGIDLQSIEGTTWFGLYMNGQKVGYGFNTLDIADNGSVSVIEDASFKLNMVGMKQDMRIHSERLYAEDGALRTIKSHVDDVTGPSEFEAVVDEQGLHLTSRVGGQERKERLPKPKESLDDMIKLIALVNDHTKIGDKIDFSIFEPMYRSEMQGTSVVTAIEKRMLDGAETTVYTIESVLDQMGIKTVSFVTEDGLTLEDQIAGGIITMRLEPEEIAKDVDYTNDVIVSNAATVDTPIKDPRERDSIRLRIAGPLDADNAINDHRQSFEKDGESYVFTGRRQLKGALRSLDLPIKDDSVQEWLKPTVFVQSDNPRMIEKAKTIVRGETDAFRIVQLLSAWVFDNVNTTFSARLTNSLEVLDHMEGDCTEHSMLFIGLARAAGIPAREAAGLIYVDGPRPGFYFHQWATAWVGEWVDVDPTFDQPIADATHIKLAQGDLFQQTRLLPVIGRLHIEVLGD